MVKNQDRAEAKNRHAGLAYSHKTSQRKLHDNPTSNKTPGICVKRACGTGHCGPAGAGKTALCTCCDVNTSMRCRMSDSVMFSVCPTASKPEFVLNAVAVMPGHSRAAAARASPAAADTAFTRKAEKETGGISRDGE